MNFQKYILCNREDLSESYVQKAEKELSHLATLIGPDDDDINYIINQHASTHRTIYEDTAVKKYLLFLNKDKVRIKELENSLSIALNINDQYQRENQVLKKRAEEAEGENTIIKGIGQNSPEMKALKAENNNLKNQLAISQDEHQYDLKVYQQEIQKMKK
jgi:hypothetical protein